MFQYDLTDARKIDSKADRKNAFETWAHGKLPKDGLHLQYENGKTSPFKGKTHVFVATSWGDYVGGDGLWRRFVSYRAPVVNHTIVYTWTWDGENWSPMTQQSFIQF